MKKWLILLSCLLIAAAVAIVAILNNSNTRIGTLNQDLYDARTEADTLKKKAEENEDTIRDLNQQIESRNRQIEDQSQQIEDQSQQIENLNTEKEALAAENTSLNESLENMNRNLSSSQQKLQGVLYILTDGEQGNIEGLLSPLTPDDGDAGTESPYGEAVMYVTEHQLMIPLEEEWFGAEEPATLGDLGEGWQKICNLSGTRAEAAASLLQMEKAWLEAKAESVDGTAENGETTGETPSEPATEGPAEEAEAEPAAEPVEETEAEPAAEPSEETEAEPAAEPSEETETEPAAEIAEEAETEPAAEPVEETPAEAVTEAPEEETAAEEPMEDEELLLTRERLLSLCEAICYENGWELPEINLPESGAAEASRGDLAIALMKLDQITK